MVTILILAVVIFSHGQDIKKNEAKMVREPFAGGDALHAIQEVALDLKEHASGADDRVAVRVCSREKMPIALLTATTSPFVLQEFLEHYGFTPQRILFLRSGDCLAQDPSIVVTEFWAIPKGAAPPASVESITADQAQVQVVKSSDTIKSANGYLAALRALAQRVSSRPEGVAVVIGSYYERPSAALERNLKKARSVLKQSNVQANRIYIHTAPVSSIRNGDEREPAYPTLFVFSTKRA
jgi:hypothetical protein